MAVLGSDRDNLNFRQEEGTSSLRSFIESTIVSQSAEVDRITRYTLYWNFYKGRHWRYYNETFLAFNYVKAFIDKVNNFLLGNKSFTTNVVDLYNRDLDEKIESAIEGAVDYVWRRNNKCLLSYELFQMGSITGDAWLNLQWDTKEKRVRIDVCDSRHCFPGFKNGNVNMLDKFTLRQPLLRNANDYKIYVVEYTVDTITTWYQKDTSEEGKRFEEKEDKNPYGFIPIVHFKNKPASDEFYGRSDVADILKINKVYNELAQEVKNIIDYYGTPTTVITGGTIKSVRKGLGNIWSGLPPEANVFNLGLGEDLQSTIQFMQLLKTSMHEIADVPENALGKLQAISNTSAAALQITYQPLMQQANQKWISYGEGIAQANMMILKMMFQFDRGNEVLAGVPPIETIESNYQLEPVFTYGLPQDMASELNNANLELNMKIASRREIMARLGKTNIPKLMDEIEDDLVNLKEIDNIGFGGQDNQQPNNEPNNGNQPPQIE